MQINQRMLQRKKLHNISFGVYRYNIKSKKNIDLTQGKGNTHVLMEEEGKNRNYIHTRKIRDYSCRAREIKMNQVSINP